MRSVFIYKISYMLLTLLDLYFNFLNVELGIFNFSEMNEIIIVAVMWEYIYQDMIWKLSFFINWYFMYS